MNDMNSLYKNQDVALGTFGDLKRNHRYVTRMITVQNLTKSFGKQGIYALRKKTAMVIQHYNLLKLENVMDHLIR